MNKTRTGFTLIELVVVVLIMGILAAIGIPYYGKTVEVAKAGDAAAIGYLVGNSYRMYLIDNPATPLTGQITDACNTGDCDTNDSTACRLVRCNYMAKQTWTDAAYNYFVGGTAPIAAYAKRNGGSDAYSNWGYNFDTSGGCTPFANTNTPPCPKF